MIGNIKIPQLNNFLFKFPNDNLIAEYLFSIILISNSSLFSRMG